MTVKIKNQNTNYGSSEIFEGQNLEAAVSEMETCIRGCGEDFEDVVVTDDDYEIIESDE